MSQSPSAGQYSPDGQWYWDGRQWIPAHQRPPAQPVQQPQWTQPAQQPQWAQPTQPQPPRRRGSPLKYILIAVALMVALVGCSIGGVVLVFLHTQGVITLPFLPPTAATILAKPLQGSLRDAAVHETIKDKDSGAVTTAEGAMTFSPKITMKLSYSGPDGHYQEVWSDGLTYGSAPGGWQIQPGSMPSDLSFLGWADTTIGRQSGTIVGEDSLPQGKSWHVKDIDGYDEFWIRESDGFPVKVEQQRAYVHASVTFDNYNQGVTITPPSGSDLSTKVARGQAGQDVDGPAGTVKVTEVQNPWSGGGRAEPGYRKVAVRLTYTSTTSSGSNLVQLALNDSRGYVAAPFPGSGSSPSPALPTTDLRVAAGQSTDGWVTFDMKDDARGLVLQAGGSYPPTHPTNSKDLPTYMILVSL